MDQWNDFIQSTKKKGRSGEWALLARRYYPSQLDDFLESISYQEKLSFITSYQEEIDFLVHENKEYAIVNSKVYRVPSNRDIAKFFIDSDSDYYDLFLNFIEEGKRVEVIKNAYLSYVSTL